MLLFVCLLTKLIKVVRCNVGTIHDFQMYKTKNFEISKKIKILVDLGFQGIQKEYVNSVLPHKKTKLKPLTDAQKAENKQQALKRVIVEHINRECKIFRICSSRYRGKHQNYQDDWMIVTGIVNLKQSTRNLLHSDF